MERLTNQGRQKRLSVHLDSGGAWYPFEVPCRPEDVLRASVDQFKGTQVDTFVCHVAIDIFVQWGIEQWVGDPTAYPNNGTTQYRMRENLRQLTEAGHDPIALMRDACRTHGMDFYLGNRTNEIHHGAWQYHPKIWVDHPEYRIGENPGGDGRSAAALNYAFPQVRDYRRKHIEFILEQYDVDGLENDFTRFPYFFKQAEAEASCPLMTEWVRGVRELIESWQQKRGHQILHQIRVTPSLVKLNKIGLDVAEWMREGLVDVVVVTPWFTPEWEMPVGEFLDAARGTSTTIVAGFEPGFYGGAMYSLKMWRAAALRHWRAGAEGIHIFNTHYYQWARDPMLHIREIADPQLLSHRDKLYVLSGQRDTEPTGMEKYCSYEKQVARILGNPTAPDSAGITGELVEAFEVEIADDIEQGLRDQNITALELRMRVLALTGPDILEVTLNQDNLPFPTTHRVLCHEGAARYYPPEECDYLGVGASTWLIWDLLTVPNRLCQGANVITVAVRERNPQVPENLVVLDIEVKINYCPTESALDE